MQEINEPEYFTINEFIFESGKSLSNLEVEYTTLGTPKFDSEGFLENAILYLHGWSGDYSSVKRLLPITGPDGPLDIDEFYIIAPSSLGSPGSASPSSTSLGHDFPEYSIKDMAKFHHTFLKEKFNLRHLKGVIGNSMGGFQALQFALDFTEFTEFLILLVSSYQVTGLNYANFLFTNSLIERDPEYEGGHYKKNPERSTASVSEYMYQFGLSKEYYRHELSNNDIAVAMGEMGLEGSNTDANDIVWRNKAALDFDLEDQVPTIKARTLIVGINQDQYFPPHMDAIPLSKMIKNSELLIYDSLLGHIGTHEIEKVETEINEFLRDFK